MCHKHLDKSVLMHLFKFLFTNTKIIIQYRLTYIHPLTFFNLVIVHTLDFWYMIKNKEATDSAALEFCHILNKFAAQLDECLSFKVY